MKRLYTTVDGVRYIVPLLLGRFRLELGGVVRVDITEEHARLLGYRTVDDTWEVYPWSIRIRLYPYMTEASVIMTRTRHRMYCGG